MKKKKKKPQATTRVIDVLKESNPEAYQKLLEQRRANIQKNKEISKSYKQPNNTASKSMMNGKAKMRSKG
jgi:predicted ATP-binding protein involved in virulence